MMTLKEFKQQYAGAPIDDIELCETILCELESSMNSKTLRDAAYNYLVAVELLDIALESTGIDRG